MKKLFGVVLVSCLCAIPSAFAADDQEKAKKQEVAPEQVSQASTKIGVIDLREIMEKAPQAKAYSQQLREKFEPRQNKIINAQKQLEQDDSKLKRDTAIITEKQKNDLVDKIENQKRDLVRMQQDYQQDLLRVQNQQMGAFFEKLKKIVDTYAEQNHYDLIVQKSSVPYSSSRIDITADILAEIKKAS